MNIAGEHVIPAAPEAVWAALNDPEVLAACIPGCQSLEMQSPTAMSAVVVTKIGPIKATFKGAVTLSDLDPPRSYRIAGEGQGGIAGFAKGGANVALTPEGGATRLSYTVDAVVGGKLAQLGGRLIESTAKKLSGQFFEALVAHFDPETAVRASAHQ
ncbi:carbon monoxide dehydrogenase [Arsenicitalea aurantiaca]|uniref:Carbon monoxide dehydrogenase n=1 Tax=Arsenicitalea aurantiaca TaxID=1783274 RepID=A0A433X494_9HYPH|nr:carbon monoxide dehydrogenase subunit G [Arsenicitalea aurantiaca]RUT28887.1 carbon monoxide dehydrogenase [Arsenicitalea aurantiaca]